MLIESMKNELVEIDNWLSFDKLMLNAKKCEPIFFTNGKNKKHLWQGYILLNSKIQILKQRTQLKYLGVHFNITFSWEKQINDIICKINYIDFQK